MEAPGKVIDACGSVFPLLLSLLLTQLQWTAAWTQRVISYEAYDGLFENGAATDIRLLRSALSPIIGADKKSTTCIEDASHNELSKHSILVSFILLLASL